MQYKIREMKDSDIVFVGKIEADIFSDSWSEASLRSSLEQEHVRMTVAEACENKEILGYHIFYISLDEGDVARIAVLPACLRRGIAEALLEEMWEHCQGLNVKRVLLEVRESNENAIALYEKQGFSSLGVRKGYYQEPLENGVIMEKQIDITTSI